MLWVTGAEHGDKTEHWSQPGIPLANIAPEGVR